MGKSRASKAEGVRTLSGLVKDFKERLGPEGPLEHGYMEWMRNSFGWSFAVDRAVRSIKPNGKRHNHQSRIPMHTLLDFGSRIKKRIKQRPSEFHKLFEMVKSCSIRGIGPVTEYDVAVRLGYFLDLQPDRIYLHAGVKLGADALGISTKGKEWLTYEELPAELRSLTADEVEDFLCVYRTLFPKLKGGSL